MADDDVKPTPWRLQHGAVESPGAQIRDSQGAISAPFSTRDTLDRMLAAKTITSSQWSAGRDFQADFHAGHLDGPPVPDVGRIPGQAARNLASRVVSARKRIRRAMEALGGHGSPCGECAWFILGLGQTLADWAHGRPLKRETASGVLIGTLGVLAAVYGHESS